MKEFILDSGLVSAKDFKEIEKEAKSKNEALEVALLRKGKLDGDELRRIQAMILGIPFVDLKNQKIDFETLSLIPEPVARNHNIVAFRRTPEAVEVAMLDTDNLAAIDFVRKKVGLKVLPRLTDRESVKSALLQYQKSLRAEFGDIIKKEATAVKTIPEDQAQDVSGSDLRKMAEDLPVIRIVDTLIKHAIIQNASDIHIEPMENQVAVRYRIDGLLRDAMVLPKNVTLSMVARIKVLANLKLDEKRLPQDGRFRVDMTGEKVSFRVSVLPVYFGEKIVMRLLRENVSGFTLESLGFHGEALESVHASTRLTTGIVLNTGPTGSGKTTTLYTILEILNKPQVNISTIEDPIEYQIERINQTQVKPEIGLTFASGLRSLVRQDPDIIMVGEIRDNETASLAINASLTGHLVLSTLHTNSAAGAFPRLVDMKAEPFLIVSTVDVVIGQRLVRKLTDKREKYFLKPAELENLDKTVDLGRILKFLKAENIVSEKTRFEEIPFFRPRPGEAQDSFSGNVASQRSRQR
ncbi:MAG: Type II secretion system protein E [Parcubacteria group bacterium Gr01-1014_107]|nr:MAG: Type II secretion system protein E [Parcubacteria group bacterium Gr01-1014_107]